VRSLVTSTVGGDERQLLGHRTEPVIVDVFVDEIMAELGMWKAYDDAQQELTRRYTHCSSATPADAPKLPTPTAEQEQRLNELAELEERLEKQRLRDWSEYGAGAQDTDRGRGRATAAVAGAGRRSRRRGDLPCRRRTLRRAAGPAAAGSDREHAPARRHGAAAHQSGAAVPQPPVTPERFGAGAGARHLEAAGRPA
jgi:hypothetical protein